MVMESLTKLVKGTTAQLTHACNSKVYYEIETDYHKYQLEMNSLDTEFETTYLFPQFRAITLMRWIRKGLENGTFIQLF